jgi:hypothetical protein
MDVHVMLRGLLMFKSVMKIINKTFSKDEELEVIFSSRLVVNNEISPARVILKEAAALKKAKQYNEACEKLILAFESDDAHDLMLKEKMRLPMYLQLAKRSEEGWENLCEINEKFRDTVSQAEISNQMRIFLQKEKKFKDALVYAVWNICKELERDKRNIQNCIQHADMIASTNTNYLHIPVRNKKSYGETPKGNVITDSAFQLFNDRIDSGVSIISISDRITTLLKKLKKSEDLDMISRSISKYLKSNDDYNFSDVEKLIESN